MLFTFLKKQKLKTQKLDVLKAVVGSMNIDDDMKILYFESLSILEVEDIDRLFIQITRFVEEDEIKEVQEIKKESFMAISGMTKKEAVEKQKDINAFSFLLNNL